MAARAVGAVWAARVGWAARDAVRDSVRDAGEGGRFKTMGQPIKLSDTPVTSFQAPPLQSQHTRQVLQDTLGYSPEEIARLEKEGVVSPPPS